ncbi:MAG: hypothetical protein WCY25_10850 [Moheibacter sp.]
MYRIAANFYKDFYIYEDDILLMTAKRKYIWFAGVRVKVFLVNDKLLLAYRYFSFFYTFLKIKYQNLPYEVQIDRKWGNIAFKVNNHRIYCNLSSLPHRKMGQIKIDGKEVAIITNKKIFGSSLEFKLEFVEKSEFEIYCILLFLMNISAVESF